jgi:hypothetical protein
MRRRSQRGSESSTIAVALTSTSVPRAAKSSAPDTAASTFAAIMRTNTSPYVHENRSDMNQETVWIFHGERAQFASAVFTSEADALSWASTHRVSGIVTEYPVGDGCYDLAVARGSFTPSKPHHGTPEHVAAFSPGWTRHIHLMNGRPSQ